MAHLQRRSAKAPAASAGSWHALLIVRQKTLPVYACVPAGLPEARSISWMDGEQGLTKRPRNGNHRSSKGTITTVAERRIVQPVLYPSL